MAFRGICHIITGKVAMPVLRALTTGVAAAQAKARRYLDCSAMLVRYFSSCCIAERSAILGRGQATSSVAEVNLRQPRAAAVNDE